jgi:large subunit ribosomal protein L6
MSRIGKQPIKVPAQVQVRVGEKDVHVKGPKGELQQHLPQGIRAEHADGVLRLKRSDDSKQQKALHGMSRALLANAVHGVSQGFSRELEIEGIGFRAAVEGRDLVLSLGFSHPVRYPIPKGIDVKVDKQVRLLVAGPDRQQVGQVSAEIRGLRPPDVYKGKGVRYSDEIIKKKVGKKGATA